MKIRKATKARAGFGRDVRQLVSSALADQKAARLDADRAAARAGSLEWYLTEANLRAMRAEEELADAKACMGEDFAGFQPRTIEFENSSSERESGNPDTIQMRVVDLNLMKASAREDQLAQALHIRVRFLNEEVAYGISNAARRMMPKAVLAKNVARELAACLVEKL